MPDYRAPLRDMQFAITELAGLERLAALPGYEEVTPDLAEVVLEEAAKLAGEVLAPVYIEIGIVEVFPEGARDPGGKLPVSRHRRIFVHSRKTTCARPASLGRWLVESSSVILTIKKPATA